MECSKCENMKGKCTIEELCGIGQLKLCPYISEPVLNEYGWLLNPHFKERYQLTEGHILLMPEEAESGWKINWMITKNGVGSCGSSKPDLFVISYQKAIEDILSQDRLNEIDRLEIKEIFDLKFDKRRTFLNIEIDHEVEEIPEVVEEKYISPFEDISYGTIGDQMELF